MAAMKNRIALGVRPVHASQGQGKSKKAKLSKKKIQVQNNSAPGINAGNPLVRRKPPPW